MGYSPITCIENLYKRNGKKLGDIADLLPDILDGNHADKYLLNGNNAYNHPIASFLLIGVDIVNGNIVPQIFEVDPDKFINCVKGKGRLESTSTNNKYFSFENPMYKNYNNKKEIPGILMTTSELTTLNPQLTKDKKEPYAGARADSLIDLKTNGDYWNSTDKYISGYNANKDEYNKNKVSKLALLFYTTHLIHELQVRYGYHVPDPVRPYSSYNWLKVSDDMKPSTSCRYYKIMFLPVLDAFLHAGVVDNPSIMTKEFVALSTFDNLITSMTNATDNSTEVGDHNNYNMHYAFRYASSALLRKGDAAFVCGQYIYSKDFRYKMTLWVDGGLYVYKLPLTAAGLNQFQHLAIPIAKDFDPKIDQTTICALQLQSDNNIVIYANPTVKTPIGGAATISGGSAVAHTNTDNTPIGSTYSMLVLPGGAVVVAGTGNAKRGSNTILHTNGAFNNFNLKTNTNRLDPDCINGWANRVGNDNLSVDYYYNDVSPDNTCYVSPLVKYTGLINGTMRFSDTDLQIVGYQAGYDKFGKQAYDIPFQLINGLFMRKAKSLGASTQLTDSIMPNLLLNYCMRGDRAVKDSACQRKFHALTSNKDYAPVVDWKMKSLCASKPSGDSAYDMACSFLSSDAKISKLLGNEFLTIAYPDAYIPADIKIKGGATTNLQSWMDKQTSLTVEQLDVLFNFMTTPQLYQTWIALHTKATGATAFGKASPSQYIGSDLYNATKLVQYPTTLIIFKTTAGMYVGYGDMGFPYTTTTTSYKATDIFWRQVLNSAMPVGGSKWAGPTFLPIRSLEKDLIASMGTEMTSILQPILEAGCYDNITLTITNTGAENANALVWMKTVNKEKLIRFVRSIDDFKQNMGLYCSNMADVCYLDALTYIQTKPFDLAMNAECDRASSAITGETDSRYYSSANAASLRDACATAYAKTNCANPSMRYKSGFENRRAIRPSFAGYTHKENYSGVGTCIDMCDTATAGTQLYEACRTGSIEYCKQGNNAISQQCIKDSSKYAEVADLVKSYCAATPTASNCSSATPISTSATYAPTNITSDIISSTSATTMSSAVAIPSVVENTAITTTSQTVYEMPQSSMNELVTPTTSTNMNTVYLDNGYTAQTSSTADPSAAAVVFQVPQSDVSELITPTVAPAINTSGSTTSSTTTNTSAPAMMNENTTYTNIQTSADIAQQSPEDTIEPELPADDQTDLTLLWIVLIIVALLIVSFGSVKLISMLTHKKKPAFTGRLSRLRMPRFNLMRRAVPK